MKNLVLVFIAIAALALTSCSTCYECSEDVILYSGSTPTDTVSESQETCTADQSEIDEREGQGATCVSQ